MSKKEKKILSSSNPFSILKGLSVFAQDKDCPQKKLPLEAPPLADFTLEPDDDVDQFEKAMDLLGVRQTTQSDALEKSTPLPAIVNVATEPELSPIEGHPLTGSRRQVRKLVQRIGAPDATLDLHGVAAADVIRQVGHFLENAVFHGSRSVRIVPGKGSHSVDGPVLRPLVEAYLSGPGRQFVKEWTRAPLQHGGAGALLVLLRQQ